MAGDIDDLNAFPFLEEHFDGLKAELPTYLTMAADVDTAMESLEWRKRQNEAEGLTSQLSTYFLY